MQTVSLRHTLLYAQEQQFIKAVFKMHNVIKLLRIRACLSLLYVLQRVVCYLYNDVRLWCSCSARMRAEVLEITTNTVLRIRFNRSLRYVATFRFNLLSLQCCAAIKKCLIKTKSMQRRITRSGVIGAFLLAIAGCVDQGNHEDLPMPNQTHSISELVNKLGLEAHIEGGYFRQTFKSANGHVIETENGNRVTMTSIYYLLTADSPIGHFHKNTSDIMHYFHAGDPITYYLIYPDGRLETKVLGSDVMAGQTFQFIVEGGVWKASSITTSGVYGYGLIGEAVAPGFEYEDMELGKPHELLKQFPQHDKLINRMSR